ncbi:MAG TPA: transketolase family protein [Candidatus Omnitrophota bacterium]|nr:transketolase family protein [Candidatus Omnitrophota bacterium]
MLPEKPKMIPTRDGFGEGVVELGKENKEVVVLSADLTDSTRASWFKKAFPGRFFGLGVAEQDMIGVATGFALMGKVPFACTFGVFASGRAWDQIRVSVAYMKSNVKIVGTHGGISVGPDGATHQAIEEISLMRILPNMTMIVPCDAIEAKKATIAAGKMQGPVYLRFGRSGVPVITRPEDRFEIGKANTMIEGRDVTIFACGQMVYEGMLACDILKKEGISARLVNMHTAKPIDTEAIKSAARDTGAIVTAEEHTTMGGLGSAISEVVVQNCPVPLKMVGVQNRFGASGEPEELFKLFKLTADDIAAAAKSAISMKRK